MAQVAIFKEIFDQVRKDLDCELFFYSELKRHNVSHYIYYLATDNIYIIENDNTVLIKGLKKVVNVKCSRNTHLMKRPMMVEIKRNHISAIQGKSC